MISEGNLKNMYIKIVKPFKIFCYEYEKNILALFTRRKKITTNYTDSIIKLNELLNANVVINIGEFVSNYFQDESKLLKYINHLLSVSSIEIHIE